MGAISFSRGKEMRDRWIDGWRLNGGKAQTPSVPPCWAHTRPSVCPPPGQGQSPSGSRRPPPSPDPALRPSRPRLPLAQMLCSSAPLQGLSRDHAPGQPVRGLRTPTSVSIKVQEPCLLEGSRVQPTDTPPPGCRPLPAPAAFKGDRQPECPTHSGVRTLSPSSPGGPGGPDGPGSP